MRRRSKSSSSSSSSTTTTTAGGGGERLHSHRRTRGGDLFFCFSSRPSAAAAAMRAPPSKPLLSPDRGRDPAAAPSLSASLSRRLRNSGSVKGGQSPMFPSVVGGRRKGVAFEAAEPSSPKVTCIGQVRVKSKKKKAAAAAAAAKASVVRSRSMRGSGRGASFRRGEEYGGGPRECLPSRNQVWVYQLPVSICEALRAFGSEFNCFFPCSGRSLCSSSRSASGRDSKCGEKRSNSCGAVFARWLMAVSDNEDGKRGEVVQVMVEDARQAEMLGVVVKERLKVEDLELEMGTNESEEMVMVVEDGQEKEEDEEEARVSICIPPRNALLLMRCRSDPVRMAELATRFWDSPAMQHVRIEEEKRRGEKMDVSRYEEAGENKQHQDEEEVESIKSFHGEEAKEEKSQLNPDEKKQHEEEVSMPVEEMDNALRMDQMEQTTAAETENGKLEERPPEEGETTTREGKEKEGEGRRSSSCSSMVGEEERKSNRHASRLKEGGRRRRSSASRERDRRRHSFSTDREVARSSFGGEKEVRRASFSVEAKGRWSFSIEKDGLKLEKDYIGEEKKRREKCSAEEKGSKVRIEAVNSDGRGKEGEEDGKAGNGDEEQRQAEREEGEKRGEEKKNAELPDCLLLMMYEPKLSMEVSKETWVCSTDFLRWRLHHPNYRPRHPSKSAVPPSGITTVVAADSGQVTKTEASKENTDDNEVALPVPVQDISQPPPLPPPPLQQTAPPVAENKPRGNAGAPPSPAPVLPPSYGPLVLTRCKSEPMRSSARLTPDAWFWKDRHRPVGATGIGF